MRHREMIRNGLVIAVLLTVLGLAEGRRARNVEELSRCVRMAEPLVHNPDYVFPLTAEDIHGVCRMWGSFVECVRAYTKHFLSPDQLDAFSAAIEPSMQSIHQLCAEDINYRTAYLAYAPCMKKIYITREHCGDHYQYLADLVQGNAASQDLMCCAHHKFRSCVLSQTPKQCGETVSAGVQDGITASEFVTSMLDRALGFLLQQCTAYRPTEAECPGLELTNALDNYKAAGVDSLFRASPSPYSPVSSTSLLPSSTNGLYNSSREGGPPTRSDDPWRTSSSADRVTSSPFKTYTNFDRDFRGNRLDEPQHQLFRGISGASCSLHQTKAALIIVSIVYALRQSIVF